MYTYIYTCFVHDSMCIQSYMYVCISMYQRYLRTYIYMHMYTYMYTCVCTHHVHHNTDGPSHWVIIQWILQIVERTPIYTPIRPSGH